MGISGSSGAVYGARLLEVLAGLPDVETHLVMTRGAEATIGFETSYDPERVRAFADVSYDDANVGAAIASGTFITDGMIVAPCSKNGASARTRSRRSRRVTIDALDP